MEHRGIVHQHVDAAESGHGGGDHRVYRLMMGNFRTHRDGGIAQRCRRGLGSIGVHVGDHHPLAFQNEAPSRCHRRRQ